MTSETLPSYISLSSTAPSAQVAPSSPLQLPRASDEASSRFLQPRGCHDLELKRKKENLVSDVGPGRRLGTRMADVASEPLPEQAPGPTVSSWYPSARRTRSFKPYGCPRACVCVWGATHKALVEPGRMGSLRLYLPPCRNKHLCKPALRSLGGNTGVQQVPGQLPVGAVPHLHTWSRSEPELSSQLQSKCGQGPLPLEAPGKSHFLDFPSC